MIAKITCAFPLFSLGVNNELVQELLTNSLLSKYKMRIKNPPTNRFTKYFKSLIFKNLLNVQNLKAIEKNLPVSFKTRFFIIFYRFFFIVFLEIITLRYLNM